MVEHEQATVFRGARRRYFTRKAAERSFAMEAVRKHCECEPTDRAAGDPGFVCRYHAMDPDRFNRLIDLYTALFVRNTAHQDPQDR